jgi:predicted nucleotidyltransferase
MQATSIGDALFTKTQQRVLGLLYGVPDKSFYTNEIMRWADMGRGTIRRELDRLVSAGILSVTPEGNQNHYQAKQDNPVYTELLGIVRKTFGVVDVIKQALKPLNAQINLAFIYGSIAKGTDVRTSDIDLMLIGEGLNYSDVIDVLMPLEESLQRSVNPTVFTSAEFASRLDQNSSFLVRVMEQPKLVIRGVIDDFREPRTD